MNKSNRVRKSPAVVPQTALDEVLHLYNGWLAYLLRRLGEECVRVEAADLKEALDTLSCRVEREGNGYVISMKPVGASGARGDTDE